MSTKSTALALFGARQNFRECFRQVGAVAQPGQGIGEGQLANVVVRFPVLDGEAAHVRARLDDPLLKLARAPRGLEIESERADDPAVV